MRSCLLSSLVSILLALAAGCSGGGNVGDACGRPGSEDDCADGAICAVDEASDGEPNDPVWGTYSCRAICDAASDCPDGFECRGVSGAAMKSACQPLRTSP
jgi:hypothetical protein